MRRLILAIVIGVFVLALIGLGSGMVRKIQKQRRQVEKISSLPSFTLSDLNLRSFNSSQIKIGPVLVMHFHPECDHCRYEISEIFRDSVLLNLESVILISGADPDSIRNFLAEFNYRDYSNVIPLADTSDNFGEIFGSDVVPSNYIYDKDLRLIKKFFGEVRPDAIVNNLRRIE